MDFFSLFNKKNKQSGDRSIAYYDVDFHSHLIPGIDDGSQSYEESFGIISFFKSIGVKKMITTPHVSLDFFQNTHEDILERFRLLKEAARNAGIDMELEVAAEYMIDDGFKTLMNTGNLLTFGDRFLLVELGGFSLHPDFSQILFDLQSAGYNVILAHPERYAMWYHSKQEYTHLKERDIIFQLNVLSLTNAYSAEVQKTAKWLIENNMIDFVGSDVHSTPQLALYRNALQSNLYQKLRDKEIIRNNELL